MSQATLRNVTLMTVANYSHAAERVVGAYRAGGQRLINALQSGVERATTRGAEVIVPSLVAAVRRANEQFGNVAFKGLDAVSSRTERAIEIGKAGVTAQVERVATIADGIDNRVLANGVQTAVRLGMPGANVALKVSERIAANVDNVYGTVAGKQPVKAVRKAVAKTLAKAKKASAPVARTARKAVSKSAPVKAVRRAAKAAVEAVNA